MALPKDFQFTDNPTVNVFAEERAVLMFGKDWKTAGDLQLIHHSLSLMEISPDSRREWALLVEANTTKPNYKLSCIKNGEFEDAAANTAATLGFYADGNLSYWSHFSKGIRINPPDGTPSYMEFRGDGAVYDSRYATGDDLSASPASKLEIVERMETAKRRNLAKLCEGSQEIVALSASNQKYFPREIISPSILIP